MKLIESHKYRGYEIDVSDWEDSGVFIIHGNYSGSLAFANGTGTLDGDESAKNEDEKIPASVQKYLEKLEEKLTETGQY